MAVVTTNKLVIVFATSGGANRTISISEINPSIIDEGVEDIVRTLRAATSVFDPDLLSPKSVKLVATTTTDMNLP